MNKHRNANIRMRGLMPNFFVGALQTVKTPTPVWFFEHRKADCRPIATNPEANFPS